MSLKVVFVTSAQPSANPRMVKSALTLSSAGYDVTVIYARISAWASDFDQQLFQDQKNIKWIGVGLLNSKSIVHFCFRLRQMFWRLVNFFTYCHFVRTAKSFTLYSQELTAAALKHKADLYIGHNLGALRAVVLAAQKYKSKCIFDLEDYYSGEFEKDSFDYKLIVQYEKRFIPQLNHVTASSPLIADLYKSSFPDIGSSIVLNVFPLKYINKEIIRFNKKPLKLFWFSQFVGLERGLQNILKAIACFEAGQIHFTILGNCNDQRKEYLSKLISTLSISESDIYFHKVISEVDLFKLMTTHHVGIASEIPSLLNKDICMSNKMFSYLLAGLALVVSDTKGQSSFLNTYPNIGFIYDNDDHQRLVQGLKNYIENPHLLNHHRENALALANSKYNWESQSTNLVSLIECLTKR